MTIQDAGPYCPIALTRENIAGGVLHDMITRGAPQVRLLSADEMRRSLADTLAVRPPGAAWVFGYGSLIWNPTIHFVERRTARISGWHRRFCLSTPIGRGTPENPGLLLGMDEGGSCTGAAFRVEDALLADELALLWRREMLAASYVPHWLPVRALDGEVFGHALTFTINRSAPHYTGLLDGQEIVRRIATARGEMGSSSEYLFQTRDGLRSLGIEDPEVEELAAKVTAWQQAAAATL